MASSLPTSQLLMRAPWNRAKVSSAEDLWKQFEEYAQHTADTPFYEMKMFSSKEGLRTGSVEKMRPLTVEAFCNFLGISPRIWREWKKTAVNGDEYFHDTMDLIEANVHDNMFQGAAADFFNASIISRKLGLVEKTEVATSAPDPTEGQERHLAVHIHPDDPDPLDTPRPLYSLEQLDAGVPFTAPRRASGTDARVEADDEE